jgi:predicted small integral membrane protein
MKQRKSLDIFLLCLKIILPILLLIPLIFFSYRLIEGRIYDIANIGTEGYHSGIGLYIFLSHFLLLVVNAVLLIISGIGLIIAKKYKATPIHKKNVRAFVWLTLAPIFSQLLYLTVTLITMSIG